MVEITCIVCGNKKKVKPSRSSSRFCSQRCACIWRNKYDKESRILGIREFRLSTPRVKHVIKCVVCGSERTVRVDAKDQQFCSISCAKKTMTGDKNSKWRGGIVGRRDGRRRIYKPDHPNAHKNGGYVLEYRLIVERKIGRYLREDEIIHHINGDAKDNRPENLEIITRSEHSRLHAINYHKTKRNISIKE